MRLYRIRCAAICTSEAREVCKIMRSDHAKAKSDEHQTAIDERRAVGSTAGFGAPWVANLTLCRVGSSPGWTSEAASR